jgi:hypothetical protein
MFNVSDFTFSPWKVVWREQASSFTAAVVGPLDGRAVVPDHKLMLVAVQSEDEAHYLCGALNCAVTRAVVMGYAVNVQMSAHILTNVAVPKFSPKNKEHRTLAGLAKQAQVAVATDVQERVAGLETEIDAVAAGIWGITDTEQAELAAAVREAEA